LEELTLTRPTPPHEGLGEGPRIDLSDFRALRTLRIFHLFLVGIEPRDQAWRGLPGNLETLEVYYDDTVSWHARFFDGYAEPELYSEEEFNAESDAEPEVEVNTEWEGGRWLRALLAQRQAGNFTKLKTVRVYTPEREPMLQRGQKKRPWKMHRWTPPRNVREMCREGSAEFELELEIWVDLEEDWGPGDYDALDVF
jgi:hypothetical protein